MTVPPAVAVCGFGRCGSSMVMAMLAAGGVPPAGEVAERSFELTGGMSAAARLVPADCAGRAVKMLDAALYPQEVAWPRAASWLVIWMDRDHREQARSQVKFLRGCGVLIRSSAARDLELSYRRDRGRALRALSRLGRVHTASYERGLADPAGFAEDLSGFLSPDLSLDAQRAAAVVHRRAARCGPDLRFEMSGQPAPP